MKRTLSGVVLLIGVLFLIGGAVGTLVSLVHISSDKHDQGTYVIALVWSVASLLSGWAVLSSRFLLYGIATMVQLGEAISAWATGHTGPAIYGTIITAALLLYGWRWLGELAEEPSQHSVNPSEGRS